MLDSDTVAAVCDRRLSPPAVTDRRYSRIDSLLARAAGALIWIYQRAVSPALATINPTCGCRFAPTCSHYAREALRAHGFVIGTFLTLRRLVKCGPWHPGGEDPVPPAGAGSRNHSARRGPLPSCNLVRRHPSAVPPFFSHG